jgi:hypothetical protein
MGKETNENKTNEVVFFQSATMVGVQFMEIMGDYMKRQDDPDFDVAVEIDSLYTDLSNLYFNNNE